MSSTGLGVFDSTLEKTNLWLKEIEESLGEDRQASYDALRAVLHAIRDRIIIEEAAQFAAQLPMLVRGLFFEGWKPAATPQKFTTRQEFLDYVRHKMQPRDENFPVEEAVTAVLESINHHVSEGEVEQVCHMLPKEVQDLWPGQHQNVA